MKKILIYVLLSVLLFSFLPLVSGATTFVTPTASGTIQGSYVVNVTTTTLTNMTNCTITASSTLTGDSLSSTILYNFTEHSSNVNTTISSIALEDANDWIFSGSCYNSSGDSETITSVGNVIIDNTVPTTPTSFTPSSYNRISNIPISITVTGSETTACSLTCTSSFHTQTWAMDHSANTCSDTINLANGDYECSVTATDGTNTSTSSSNALKISQKSGGSSNSGNTGRASEVNTSNNKNIFLLIIVGLVLYLIFKGNKK